MRVIEMKNYSCFMLSGCLPKLRIVTFAIFLLLLTGSYSCSVKPVDKPNILFIAVDDLRTDIGSYGNRDIVTPNIDRLSDMGLVFNNAYCQQAVCNPSRASLLTGLRPDIIKVWDLKTHFRTAVPDAITLPEYFKQNGYTVEGMGKIFHGGLSDPQSWSSPKKNPQGHSLYSDTTMKRLAIRKEKLLKEGIPESVIGGKYRGPGVMSIDEPDNKRFDGALTDLAIDAMEEITQPFFLAVGYHRPHLPFVAPKKYFDMYDPDRIPLATNPYLPKGSPEIAMNTMYELRAYEDFADTPTPFEGSLTLEQRKRLKHGYYASVSFVDAQVGRLLAALENSGLNENTIIVLWGDHGWKLGEHNSWGKMTNYDDDTHAPLIIYVPWMKRKGIKTDALVEFVDIYPTLCELAGLQVSEKLEGCSFVPLINNPGRKWKSAVFSQYMRKHKEETFMGYSLRTERYRYIEWINMESNQIVAKELYDHNSDPEENKNIAEETENKELVIELSAQLKNGWKSALPENKTDRRIKSMIK